MKLREIRALRGLTQRAVADHLGCSSVVYCRYETGEREPSIETLIRLADFFGVSIDVIVGRSEVPAVALSSYETALIHAARAADERARQDALCMLESHAVQGKKENLA